MTIGVGGSDAQTELARMADMTEGIAPIDNTERFDRITRAQALMREQGISALYLDTSVNLAYFTGLSLKPTERLHGAILPVEGPVTYLSPAFEEPKTRSMLKFGDDIRCWEEHEDPTALVADTIASLGYPSGTVAVDPATPFFTFDGLRRAGNRYDFANGASITGACRMVKSPAEIALLRAANAVTLEVHKAAARIMRQGITTTEVQAFVVAAHKKLGATHPPGMPLVLFGEASAYPHGVDYPQTLEEGDMVLLDLGAFVGGYRSDITRSYVFGEPNARQRQVWDLEKEAQAAGFAAAVVGAPCEDVDNAARGTIESAGFAKDYGLPGLPHRTGHGIGVEVHEESYMVRGNKRPMAAGMCFSVEPTVCIYGEFGIRLEDCAYLTENGPRWFTGPCHSVDDPFGVEA
ncbi:Xaa-Pro peptidase family protein [Acuticoccus sp. M5D2P5]|uniref:M24 family metallopeptidase n=1 Tax=Acuticoccus kalidii TaxID=2910977 RepID=UPI001F16517A|nr:Xaa-Pro peptidase family protein [Acuticoccus kalidii]MCF3932705.1 Xaa-Pro peptidase family protein [Acuticoccus kalidii]